MTATELRANLYRILDQVAETGHSVEIVRKGRRLRIVAEQARPSTFTFERLRPHPEALAGRAREIVHLDWSSEWRPFPGDSK